MTVKMNEQRGVFRGRLIELAVVTMMVMVTVTPFDEDDNDNDVEDAWVEKNFGGNHENISCGDDGGFGDGGNCDEKDDDHGNDAERMNGGRRGMVGG